LRGGLPEARRAAVADRALPEKLRAAGGDGALVTAGDVTVPEVRQAAVSATLDRFGAIDILINNAGMGLYDPAWSTPLPDARSMFELNFFAPLALTQLVAPHMRARSSGVIVNVSSVAGKVTLPWLTLYSASKYALGSLTDGLRMELKKDGIHTHHGLSLLRENEIPGSRAGWRAAAQNRAQQTIRHYPRAMRRSHRARRGARCAHGHGAQIRLAVGAGRTLFPFPG
jgi:short-subunit dehydrogenase